MTQADKSVRNWLLLVMLLVVAIIVVGGATRLTNSGLSITEWLPVRGVLPPLSEAAWEAEFAKYRAIDEFRIEHPDMTLSGFKFIYFWEWAHRILGRVIGLVFVLPLIWFWLRERLPQGFKGPLLGIGLLIGLQGVVGWWMVHSGLQEGMVSVSQYRLATHLGLAFLVLGSLFWMWRATQGEPPAGTASTALGSKALAGMVYLQIIAGAFVAGTGAGKTFNEWPLMDGEVVPDGYGQLSPAWRNLFENIAAIQFNHRILAYFIVGFAIYLFMRSPRHTPFRTVSLIVLLLVIWQAVLGIWTLLAVAPLSLSLLHQFSAVLLFLAVLQLMWTGRKSIR